MNNYIEIKPLEMHFGSILNRKIGRIKALFFYYKGMSPRRKKSEKSNQILSFLLEL